MSRAKFSIGNGVPGASGSLILLSPVTAKKLKRFSVPPDLLNPGKGLYVIAAFLIPRVKPSLPTQSCSLASTPHNDLQFLQKLLGDCKGKKYSITNYRKTDTVHTIALKKNLFRSGCISESLYKGKPHYLFIQSGTPPEKVPGLAYRKVHYPDLRFFTFGCSSFLKQEASKEIWRLGMF